MPAGRGRPATDVASTSSRKNSATGLRRGFPPGFPDTPFGQNFKFSTLPLPAIEESVDLSESVVARHDLGEHEVASMAPERAEKALRFVTA
jgi:hypothetical protein